MELHQTQVINHHDLGTQSSFHSALDGPASVSKPADSADSGSECTLREVGSNEVYLTQ